MRGGASSLVLAILVLAPLAAAQAPLGQPAETMALTDQAPPGFEEPSTTPCGTHAVHGLAEPGAEPAGEAKADTSRSSVAIGCPTLFRAPAPGAFNLTREVSVHLFVGCDQPTVMHEPLNNLRVWLTRNGQAVAESGTSIGPVCSPDEPMEAELSVGPPDEPGFGSEDTIGLNVTPFGSPNAAVDSLHVLVGGNETPSTVTMPGISQAYEPVEVEDPELDNETQPPDNETRLEPQTSTSGDNGVPGFEAVATVLGLAALAVARRGG